MAKEKEKKFARVFIPIPLFEKIEGRIKGTDFATVSNYVAYVLEEIVLKETSKELFASENEERVNERLKRLGYL